MSQNIPPRSLPPEDVQDSDEPSSQKDQYSLDEIMKALREKEHEKDEQGEVVTRLDGSIARKVKRRKRRSGQQEKATPEKEKKRVLLKIIIAAVLLLMLALTALFLILNQNSKSYRKKLEISAAEWTGAEVELSGFKRLPFSAKINRAKFSWPESYYLREFELKNLSGDVSFLTFLGARPSGLQLGGTVGEMVVRVPDSRGNELESIEESEFPFLFEQYYCQALNVKFGEGETVGLKGASASLRHISNEGFQVTIDQGTFQFAGWQDFQISSGLLRFKNNTIDLKSFSLEPPDDDDVMLSSNLKISGEIPLISGKQVQLDASTGNFSFSGLIGKKLARLFSGSLIESNGAIIFTVGESQVDEIVMNFSADRLKMASFPFLSNLVELFPDRNLEELEFNKGLVDSVIKGVLRVRPEGVAIENLEMMAQKGNIRIKGGVVVADSGEIRGKIAMSVNRVFVTNRPNLANNPKLEGNKESGYVNVNFRLKGTIDKPDDTFRTEVGMEAGLLGVGRSFVDDIDDDLWGPLQKTESDLTPDILGEQEE